MAKIHSYVCDAILLNVYPWTCTINVFFASTFLTEMHNRTSKCYARNMTKPMWPFMIVHQPCTATGPYSFMQYSVTIFL